MSVCTASDILFLQLKIITPQYIGINITVIIYMYTAIF